MATESAVAALDALVTYFQSALGSSFRVRRGWPEPGVDLDLQTGPVLTLFTSGEGDHESVSPYQVDAATVSESITVTYKTANLKFRAQLDLWAQYRYARDQAATSVGAVLHNDLPFTTGLVLTTTPGRPVHAVARALNFPDDGESVAAGEWRRTWMLDVQTDEVGTVAWTPAATIAIELDAESQGSTSSASIEITT